MCGGLENDRQLRFHANGEKVPEAKTAWAIGEALHILGLPWCSGLLALWEHQEHFLMAGDLLDAVCADDSAKRSIAHRWHRLARAIDLQMLEPLDPYYEECRNKWIAGLRSHLADVTSALGDINVCWEALKGRQGGVVGLERVGPIRLLLSSQLSEDAESVFGKGYRELLDDDEATIAELTGLSSGAYDVTELDETL
jgi:hypothetical protein